MVVRRRLEQLLRFYFAYLPPVYLAYLSQTTGSLESCAPHTFPFSLIHKRFAQAPGFALQDTQRMKKNKSKRKKVGKRQIHLKYHGSSWIFVLGGRGAEEMSCGSRVKKARS
jgi:hypothetical protein